MSRSATRDGRAGRPRPLAVVLHGEIPPEAAPDEQDTLAQADAVASSLERLGYAVARLAATLDLDRLRRELIERGPALVFNLVESVGGSGRLIPFVPALLDELGHAYTGVPTTGLFLTSHKLLAKRLLARHGIATPDWIVPARAAGAETPERRPGRWILKSVWEHASLGMDDGAVLSCARAGRMLTEGLAAKQARHGGEWFAEAYVEGREFNISVLQERSGPRVLPLAEITFEDFPADKPRIVGYRAKWEPESFEYRHTVRRFPSLDSDAGEARLAGTLKALALRCWDLFELKGYARVDVRLDAEGAPWVLEVNANPCLTPGAGMPVAAAKAGIGFDQMIGLIVAAAGRGSPPVT